MSSVRRDENVESKIFETKANYVAPSLISLDLENTQVASSVYADGSSNAS